MTGRLILEFWYATRCWRNPARNWIRLTATLLLVACQFLYAKGVAQASSCAYVGVGNGLSVFDIASATFTGQVPLTALGAMTASADSSWIYIAGYHSDYVSAIEAATIAVTDIRIGDGIEVERVAVSPNGQLLYVAASNGVSVVDTATDTVVAVIPVTGGVSEHGIVVAANGTRVYVTGGPGSVAVIDTTSRTVVNTVNFNFDLMSALAVSPNGARVYVAHSHDSEGGHTVSVIDTSSGAVIKNISVSAQVSDLVARPDGSEVYVVIPCAFCTNFAPGQLTIINAGSLTVSGSITMRRPVVAAVTPDGARAYVVQPDYDLFSIVDLNTRKVVSDSPLDSSAGDIAIGSGPTGCSVPSPGPTRTLTPSRTPTKTGTATPTPTVTQTRTLTATATTTPTPTLTRTQTLTPTDAPPRPIFLTSLTLFTADATGKATSDVWNTQHDSVWVLGVQEPPFGFDFAGPYLNNDDSQSPCFTCVGTVINSGAPDTLYLFANPASASNWDLGDYFGINLFLDGSTSPGISALGQVHGSTFVADSSTQTRAISGTALIPGSGKLSYTSPTGDAVTLTHLSIHTLNDFTDTINRVGPGEQLAPGGAADGVVSITLQYATKHFDIVAPANGAWCGPTCSFQWQAAAGDLAKYVLYVDDAVKRDNLSPGVSEYTLTQSEALSDGVHSWKVTACDTVGACRDSANIGSVLVDGLPPDPFDLTAPADGSWGSLPRSVQFSWSATTDGGSGLASYQLYIDDHVLGSPLATTNTTLRVDTGASSALGDGLHSWRVAAVDQVGNARSTAPRVINMDSTAPQFASVVPDPPMDTWINNSTPTLGWTLPTDPGSGVATQSVVIDPAALIPIRADLGPTTNNFTPLAPLADGLHQWLLMATDVAGNSATSPTYRFGVDTTAPTGLHLNAPTDGTADGAIVSFPTPKLCWLTPADPGSGISKFQLYIDGTLRRDNMLQGTMCTTPPAPLSEGVHQWSVRAFDAVGNYSDSETWTVIYDASPPYAFNLLSPLDGDTVANPKPIFSWEASGDAASGLARYELWLDGACVTPCNIPATQTNSTLEQPLSIGSHSWLVKAVDRRGLTTASNSGTMWSFGVVATPTATSTATPSVTPTNTVTYTPTVTPTPPSTFTVTQTPPLTITFTATTTPTRTNSAMATWTPTAASTPSYTPTPTLMSTETQTSTTTPTPTETPTASSTRTTTATQPATFTPSRSSTVSPSPIPTPTATDTPTATPTPMITPTPVATPTATPTRTQTSVLCVGDCDGSRMVGVNKLIILVNIALGNADASACPDGIPPGAEVNIALLIQAVNNALNGCLAPGSPSATAKPGSPTPTRTVTPRLTATPTRPRSATPTPRPTATPTPSGAACVTVQQGTWCLVATFNGQVFSTLEGTLTQRGCYLTYDLPGQPGYLVGQLVTTVWFDSQNIVFTFIGYPATTAVGDFPEGSGTAFVTLTAGACSR